MLTNTCTLPASDCHRSPVSCTAGGGQKNLQPRDEREGGGGEGVESVRKEGEALKFEVVAV